MPGGRGRRAAARAGGRGFDRGAASRPRRESATARRGAAPRPPPPPSLLSTTTTTRPPLSHHFLPSPTPTPIQPIPKPSRAAQATLPGAKRVPWSDVFSVAKTRAWLGRTWASTDRAYAGFMLAMHGLALLAPATFSWKMVGLFLATYFVSGEDWWCVGGGGGGGGGGA